LLVAAILIAAFAPGTASATVLSVTAVDEDGAPTDSYMLTDGVYAKVPTSASGGYVCAVRPSATACAAKPIPIPPFSVDPAVPLYAPKSLPVGTYELIGYNDGEPVSARSVQFQVTAEQCTVESDTFCESKLDAFKTSANSTYAGALIMSSFRSIAMFGSGVLSTCVAFSTSGGLFSLGGIAAGGAAFFALEVIGIGVFANQLGLLKGADIASQAVTHFQQLKADPPDPNYQTVKQPEFSDLPRPTDPDDLQVFDAHDRLAAYSGALLHALERFQGADQAGDNEKALMQLEAMADFNRKMTTAAGDVANADRAYAARIAAHPDDDVTVTQDQLDGAQAFTDRVATSGLTQEEENQLVDLGLSKTERDEVAVDLGHLELGGVEVGRSLSQHLEDSASFTEAGIPGFEEFGAELNRMIEERSARNNPPTSAFNAVPTAGDAPLAVNFDATASSDFDGQITSYEWDFGDGGTGSGATIAHTYSAPGTYTAKLTVTDDDGATATATRTIDVAQPNAPPTASFAATPTSGTVPVNVAFDATGSTDADGSIASYAWTFGDGNEAIGSAPSHTYTAAGTYTVTLTVTDDDGATAQSTATITAADPENAPPKASFTATPDSGTAPLEVAFNAGASADPDGEVSSYQWSFGDGNAASGVAPSHTFTAAGTYTVTLIVTDDDGATDTAQTTVGVAKAGNTAPTAALSAVPSSGDAPLDVTFDASGSSDHEGGIASATLDFGDGSSADTGSIVHTYTTPGTYTATLTVTDEDGATDATAQIITVTTPNKKPHAEFTADPVSGDSPLSVSFDASGSTDDGGIASYEWDFGDGAAASGVATTHVYRKGGSFTATLRVTDASGAADQATRTIEVTAVNHAPEPLDDTLDVEGTGAIDVLGNDSDADADPLRLVASGTPAHGSATCTPLGACLYTADADYEGVDEFTYKVRDPAGLEATAKVALQISKPSAAAAFSARDDRVSTRAGVPVTVDVLANDTGTGLAVTDATDPHHGTAVCNKGICTYTPASSFSGTDGFTYTVTDENAETRTADVHVTVAPSAAGYTVKTAGAPALASKTAITQGKSANWSAAVSPSPAGVSAEALAALSRPAVTAELTGPHAPKPGSVRTAKGWTADPVAATDQAVHARAGADALLGEVSDAIPAPLPAVSQGTGGDGHVPILVGSKVFAFFHHSHPTSVTCVDRSTGSLCPGYPTRLNQGTSDIPGPGVVIGSRIFVHLTADTTGQSSPNSLFCWDAEKNRTCGLIIADRREASSTGGSAPVLAAGKLYFAADGGRLHCIDPATNASCAVASIPSGLDPSVGGAYDIVSHGSRVYVSRSGDKVACLDVAAGSTCAGWTLPKSFNGAWNIVNHHSATGAADGVCVISAPNGDCRTDADPGTSIELNGWPGFENYYTVTAEAEAGTRTLMASAFGGGLGCYDWKTMAACTGGDYQDGWLYVDTQGANLPGAYGAAWDGSCVVGLGDPGLVFTVDPVGRAPCTSLGAGTEPRTIDLRDQRCDGTIGTAAWHQIALADTAAGELASVTVIVRDDATGAVLSTKDITNGALDLSGIDAHLHPAVRIEATAVSTAGDPAWADAVPPRVRVAWKADPKQLCFDTTTKADCASPLTPIGVATHLDGSAVKDQETLDLLRAECPPELAALPDRSVPEQTPLDATLGATDPNGGALKYSLVKGPAGMSIDAATGHLSWTPTEAQGPGSYDVTVKVADAGGLADQGTFTAKATEVNRPPVLAPLADATVGTGTAFAGRAAASDPDLPANRLAYSLVNPPAGASIDRTSGAIAWPAVPAGAHPLRVRVADDGSPGLSAERAFTLTSAPKGATDQSSAADLVRACTSRGVVLEDVIPAGNRVKLLGVAEERFKGRRVDIVFAATGKVVARPKVAPDGSFAATAPMPPRRLRSSNRARYQARVGGERSLNLKLMRRMLVTSVRTSGGKVTIAGKVIGPLALRARDREIVLERRVTCTRLVTVSRFRPRPSGAFKVTVPVPAGTSAAVYRLRTKVRASTRGSRLSSTFTLPRAIGFR
jgi:PKD repeat protein